MKRLPCLKRAASAVSLIISGAGSAREREGVKAEGRDPVSPPRRSLMELVDLLPSDLQSRALTHSSWVARRTGSYERLEFLGDSVLGLAIASALYERYPEKPEGELAPVKAFVVSRPSCVQVARRLGVGSLIVERAPATRQRREEAADSAGVVGNVLEALIGACFEAHGFEQTATAVVMAFDEQMSIAFTSQLDHKTALQELLALRGLYPSYQLVAEEGPPHAREFTSEVVVDGVTVGCGSGTTIKMSEQRAAREALVVLSPPSEEEAGGLP